MPEGAPVSITVPKPLAGDDGKMLTVAAGEPAWSTAPVTPNATTTTRGIVELATAAEATTGTDIARAVTPAGLKATIDAIPAVPAATTTVAGKVELATIAEAYAGTDAARAVTPVGLKATIDAIPAADLPSTTGNLPFTRVTGDIPGARVLNAMPTGTTAERDARYGTPATDAARVTLANARAVWFNTDLGWEEGYFAVTGLAGLTARGLIAGTASGWYPVGAGPVATLHSIGTQARVATNQFTNWNTFGVGKSYRNCTDAFITHDATSTRSELTVRTAGRFRVSGNMGVQAGSGTAVISLRANRVGGFGIEAYQIPAPLQSGYGNYFLMEMENVPLPVEAFIFHYLDVGALTLGQGLSSLRLEYSGPPLLSA